MEIINIKISDLKEAEYNPRRLTIEQHKHLKESIEKFGLVDPLVVNKHKGRDNVIVGGHQRLKIALELGYKEVPVVYVDLDEKMEQELNIRLNKNLGEFDWDILANFDVDFLLGVGFSEEELKFDLYPEDVKDDEAPEKLEKSDTQMGDIFLLGEHRVMCGDSTKIEYVEKLMNGKKADMVFTDPPYRIKMSRSLVSGKDNSIQNDTTDGLEDLLRDSLVNASVVSKQNVPLYCWIGFRSYSLAESVIKEIWNINNCIVWKKPSIGLGGNGYRLQHELCIFSGNITDKSQSDVWEVSRDRSGLHPTMKPVELITKALNHSSEQEQIIIDPFLGSGSTVIACEKTGRVCYGMELDPIYVDVAVKRWEQYTGREAEKMNKNK